MELSLTTCSRPRTERNILEINQELCSQLAQSKQQFRDLKEKFLISEATAYTLANQLQKYKCEEYKALTESVLGEELQFEEERPAARIGKYNSLILAQAQELIHLRQKIQEGIGGCYLFTEHVKNTIKTFEDFIRITNIANYQRQRFCDQLAQGSQLAERLISKLTT
ncbi:neuroblastoma breakpoint family member 6-like protein, partial [Trichechus manatus latirostris]|uniref:Neuroblastoma breakpoint family member 6-like protein n=1 Tax=Trichechus manatus latirostris TaxID=127582 RepID=A0A2Y9ECW5_TRIMA